MLGEMSPYILLGFLIAGVMHAFIPQHTFARHLSGTGWRSVLKAAAAGIPLPLCSCGVLPTAIAMRRGGASRAASTALLVSTPQTGVDSIAATWSLLGPAFAVVRPIAALVTAFFGGVAVGKSEKGEAPTDAAVDETEKHAARSFGAKTVDALRYGFIDLVGSIGGWLVAGLLIAALITVYVPVDFFAFMGNNPLVSMIAVVLVAVPMYVCATGSIPIAMSLILKGLSPGTAFVLLMAGPAANFASFTLISREMGKKAAWIYLTAIVVGAILFGLAIDYLMPKQWFALDQQASNCCHAASLSPLAMASTIILLVLLIVAFARRLTSRTKINSEMTTTYKIKGMNCSHCQATVAKAIGSVAGVEEVDVDLKSGIATVGGEHNADELKSAVRGAGFDVE